MSGSRPETVDVYVEAAPPEGRPHLRRIREILRIAAPDAEETIKWGTPFYVEPRFLYSFAAFTAHCNVAPTEQALKVFEKELASYRTTKNFLQLPYAEPLPEDLIRRIAEYRVRVVQERDDDAFWDPPGE